MKRKGKRKAKRPPGRTTSSSHEPSPDPLEAARAKLKELDALKKKLKVAIGAAPPAKEAKQKMKRPRFSGSWGCGA